MQFDYLLRHGLRQGDRMLEIGCGNLRAGHLFIGYLESGGYYGIDISPDILVAAQRTLTEFGLQAKLPHLALVNDLTLDFLPADYFTVVHAHSVFSHSPVEVISECMAHVGRVMAPGAIFDFTFAGPRAPSTICCGRTSTTAARPWSTSPPPTASKAS
jgi:ubiquinone/menaquinone biosynthesis C-methylase UbiE